MNSIPLALGEVAPDFEFPSGDGERSRLADFRGCPVVIAFYTSEWDPARDQQWNLYAEILRGIPGEPKLLGVSSDGLWCDLAVKDEGAVRFPLVPHFDSDGEIGRQFGVEGKQAVFVLDGEGVVRWQHIGPTGASPSADSLIAALTPKQEGISRRQLLLTAVTASLALALLPRLTWGQTTAKPAAPPGSLRPVTLNINGHDVRIAIDPRVTLLDALRERLGLMGTKKGCDHGQCGACTVHMNGRRVNSCLTLAMQAEGSKIETIEGLANGDQLHPVQAAFIKHDGFQCGYCTSGQIMSAVACIHEGHARTDEDIAEFMSGNICRCGAYPGIRAAIKEARDTMGGRR